MTDWLARLRKLDSVQYASADIAEIAENDVPANFGNSGNYGSEADLEKEPPDHPRGRPSEEAFRAESLYAETAEIAEKGDQASFGNSGNIGTGTFPENALPDPDDLEERAAIIAEGSGCPLAWAEGLARLDPNRPPGDVPQDYWMAFCDAAGAFVDRWAAKAAALGWTVEEVFGCDRHAPFARLDRRGLVWTLVGCSLVDLTKTEAVIEMPSGNRLKHRRRGSDSEPARAALAWDPL